MVFLTKLFKITTLKDLRCGYDKVFALEDPLFLMLLQYVSTFDGLSPNQMSESCPCASFCSLDGAGPGPVLKAECVDEVAPLLVDGLGILS